MTPSQQQAIGELRDAGFAIAIFTPDELREAPPERVEDLMVERGWNAINDLGGPPKEEQ